MATKVFISWSGELSRKLGEALRSWLPSSLQFVRPYFSPEDIEKGTKWSTEISKELETSNVGVICLTQDNTEKPWILFEAGALSKSLDKAKVCTLLFNLEPADVKGPLTIFQSTRFVSEDFKRLVVSINNSAGDSKLEPGVLDSVFEMWWPKLEQQIGDIIKSHHQGGKKDKRSERDILEEVLELTRMGARKAERGPRYSERALLDLVESVDELVFMAGINVPIELTNPILHRLERPLRHLCVESGVPELYDRHMRRVRDRVGRLTEKEEKGDGAEEKA
jgi:hypothetical protein